MNISILRNPLLAAAAILALAGPAQADPPWKHGQPPGWSKHHHDWPDHRGRHDREGWSGYHYGPPPVVYGRPRVIYVPPPVIYLPQRPGISIHLPLDLE